MADHGIKVSKPGYDVKTADPNELVFSSKYKTLRVKQQGSGTVTHSGGRTVTIAHNLGYVPMFLVHTTSDLGIGGAATDYYINPYDPVITGGQHLAHGVHSYADDTNLYIELEDDFGWYYRYGANDDDDFATEFEVAGPYNTGLTMTGYQVADPLWEGPTNGAFRFVNVAIAQGTTIYQADLGFYIGSRAGSNDVEATIFGIDVDDVDAFDVTGAFSNAKTTASANETCSSGLGATDTWNVTVTPQAQEIINREGWSSGNAMGMIIDDNGTNTSEDTYIADAASGGIYGYYSYLRFLLSNTLLNYKYTIFYNQLE